MVLVSGTKIHCFDSISTIRYILRIIYILVQLCIYSNLVVDPCDKVLDGHRLYAGGMGVVPPQC